MALRVSYDMPFVPFSIAKERDVFQLLDPDGFLVGSCRDVGDGLKHLELARDSANDDLLRRVERELWNVAGPGRAEGGAS